MCINKYRLWDHTQITWFYILLAMNTIFPFFNVTRSPATFSQQMMVLSCSTSPSRSPQIFAWRCSGKWPYHRFTPWFDVPSTPTIPSSSWCRRLLCNYYLIFQTRLSLTLESAQEPDCHADTQIDTCKLGCLLPRKHNHGLFSPYLLFICVAS